MVLNPQALIKIATFAAEAKKAYDILILDIKEISIISDYFLICSGRSSVHVKSIAEEIIEEVEKKAGCQPRIEGLKEGRWVLLDYGDLIVHIFQEAERRFYNLERLWKYENELNLAQI